MSCAELRIQTSCGAQAAAPQCDGKVGFGSGAGEVILKEQEIHEINIANIVVVSQPNIRFLIFWCHFKEKTHSFKMVPKSHFDFGVLIVPFDVLSHM